jgi:hypothetical protein
VRWRVGAGGSKPCRVSSTVEVVVWGAGLVKLRWWCRRPPPQALLLLLLLSPLFLSCGGGGMEKRHGWLGFRSTARVLIRGAGARVRLRPGLFGVRAGTRGGIAARRERG